MKKKIKKASTFADREIVIGAAKLIQREIAAFTKVKEQDTSERQFKSIPVLNLDHQSQDKHTLVNLISWCKEQSDVRHQIIAVWLQSQSDMLDVMTTAAWNKSQVDSRKKSR